MWKGGGGLAGPRVLQHGGRLKHSELGAAPRASVPAACRDRTLRTHRPPPTHIVAGRVFAFGALQRMQLGAPPPPSRRHAAGALTVSLVHACVHAHLAGPVPHARTQPHTPRTWAGVPEVMGARSTGRPRCARRSALERSAQIQQSRRPLEEPAAAACGATSHHRQPRGQVSLRCRQAPGPGVHLRSVAHLCGSNPLIVPAFHRSKGQRQGFLGGWLILDCRGVLCGRAAHAVARESVVRKRRQH